MATVEAGGSGFGGGATPSPRSLFMAYGGSATTPSDNKRESNIMPSKKGRTWTQQPLVTMSTTTTINATCLPRCVFPMPYHWFSFGGGFMSLS